MEILFSHQTKDGNVVMYDKEGLFFRVHLDSKIYGKIKFEFREVVKARNKYIELRQRLF